MPWTIFGHGSAYAQGMGAYGVPLFFAVSGVLIAWRILEDEQRTGRFSVKAFYIRRFFRIQPAQWAYLLMVALLMGGHVVHVPTGYWWGAFFLYENFLWHPSMALGMLAVTILVGHFWTLAVEEHFYLAISLFFVLVKRHRAAVLGTLLTLLLAGQAFAQWLGRISEHGEGRRTYWIIQYLLFASWVAIVMRSPGPFAWAKRYWHPFWAFLGTAVLMYAHHLLVYGPHRLRPQELLGMDQPVLFYSFTGWIVATMLHPGSWASRLLELAPLRFVGRISYSLYLWHLLFFGLRNPKVCSMPWLRALNGVPQRYVCALATAVLSYYFIEKPMIRLGHRLAPPTSPGHSDLRGSESPQKHAPVPA